VTLELLSNNVMEPWLYGSSTGVTPIALIFAAIFWTWLWGPIGLVLATPMTVCLVVMGRHIPQLSFLSILLSDEEALTPAEDCYHRLLTLGEQDEIELVESYLKTNSLTSLYDSVFIPVITAVETDHRLEMLEDGQRTLVLQSLRDIVEDLGARMPVFSKTEADKAGAQKNTERSCRVFCLPARPDRDELATEMLVQLLQQQGFEAHNVPPKLGTSEIAAMIEKAAVDVVCISVVAPFTVLHARYLCLKLRALLPKQKLVVGLWGVTENIADSTRRVRESGADEVITTLADAVRQFGKPATSDAEKNLVLVPVGDEKAAPKNPLLHSKESNPLNKKAGENESPALI
jgi:methylmalonyl-CoA mutase cobalamin-binding subunit